VDDAAVVVLVASVALLTDSAVVPEHSGGCTSCCFSVITLFPAALGILN